LKIHSSKISENRVGGWGYVEEENKGENWKIYEHVREIGYSTFAVRKI